MPQIQEKSPKPWNLAEKHLATNMRRGKKNLSKLSLHRSSWILKSTPYIKFTTQKIEIQRKQPCSTLNWTPTNNDEKRRPITTTTKTLNSQGEKKEKKKGSRNTSRQCAGARTHSHNQIRGGKKHKNQQQQQQKQRKNLGKKNLKSVGMPRDVIRKDRTTKSFRNDSGNE